MIIEEEMKVAGAEEAIVIENYELGSQALQQGITPDKYDNERLLLET